MNRLTADERKRQLIGIGLHLLIATPLDELSLDQVAQEAGISRSLLFHHFPTKRDYYLAVVRAASRRMLHHVDLRDHDPAPPPGPARLRAMVEGMVSFIRRRRDPYLAFVRGSAGGDPAVRAINAQTRDELVRLFVTELQIPADDARSQLQVRGWLAYAEELVLTWTGEHPDPEQDDDLAGLLLAAIPALLGAAPVSLLRRRIP